MHTSWLPDTSPVELTTMARTFKQSHSFESRAAESAKIRARYSDRVPVIVERAKNEHTLGALDKKKYLVPGDVTVAQFTYIIRKRMRMDHTTAMYVFVETVKDAKRSFILPPTSSTLTSIYRDHADEDGFLYLSYNGENFSG